MQRRRWTFYEAVKIDSFINEKNEHMKKHFLFDMTSAPLLDMVRDACSRCLIVFYTLILLGAVGGCIKHETHLEDRKNAIHYNDRFYGLSAVDENNIWIVGFYGKAIYSDNGGRTWTIQQTGTKDPLTGVEFVSVSEGWIISLGGSILHTDNGGKHWSIQETVAECAFLDIKFCGDKNGYIVGSNNTILRTENGGREWLPCDVPEEMFEDDSGGLIETSESILNAVHFIDADHGWVVGEYGMVYSTTDGGITWQKKKCRHFLGRLSV